MDGKGVASCARVCREWHNAIRHKTPCLRLRMNATVSEDRVPCLSLVSVERSVLGKHVTYVDFEPNDMIDPCEWQMLHLFPNLTHVIGTINRFDRNVMFPPKLLKLDLTYALKIFNQALCNEVNVLIACIAARAPLLKRLALNLRVHTPHTLELSNLVQRVDFAPLRRLTQLAEFSFCMSFGGSIDNATMIPSLTAMLHTHPTIRKLRLFVDDMKPRRRFTDTWFEPIALNPPVYLDALYLRNVIADANCIKHIRQFTGLTSVDLGDIQVASLDFMSAFPKCTHFRCNTHYIPIEMLVDDFKALSRLTSLELCHPSLTSEHLATILSHLPNLQMLKLIAGSGAPAKPAMRHLNNMDWVSSARSLMYLTIIECKALKTSSLDSLFSVKSLVSFHVERSFDTCIDGLTRKMFTPPSRHLPKLTTFTW